MTEFTIPAPELARLTHNALAFMPARSAVKVCRVWVSGQAVGILATDLFTVGEDVSYINHDFHATESVDLSREDLHALDKEVRAVKKEEVLVTIRHADGLALSTQGGETFSWLDSSAQRNPEDLWERCDEMLTRLEGGQGDIPPAFYHLALDPALMGRFGKVKPSAGKECIADLHLGHDDQILVKIGATFRGAIMPVDRDEAGESDSVGSDGLWQ